MLRMAMKIKARVVDGERKTAAAAAEAAAEAAAAAAALAGPREASGPRRSAGAAKPAAKPPAKPAAKPAKTSAPPPPPPRDAPAAAERALSDKERRKLEKKRLEQRRKEEKKREKEMKKLEKMLKKRTKMPQVQAEARGPGADEEDEEEDEDAAAAAGEGAAGVGEGAAGGGASRAWAAWDTDSGDEDDYYAAPADRGHRVAARAAQGRRAERPPAPRGVPGVLGAQPLVGAQLPAAEAHGAGPRLRLRVRGDLLLPRVPGLRLLLLPQRPRPAPGSRAPRGGPRRLRGRRPRPGRPAPGARREAHLGPPSPPPPPRHHRHHRHHRHPPVRPQTPDATIAVQCGVLLVLVCVCGHVFLFGCSALGFVLAWLPFHTPRSLARSLSLSLSFSKFS
ncbi:myristoylated alanine-rich C-kinase substrate-like [Perognathus longimembris pacificus]|uniref:myristoylated alanine-rich C-kinase substrate-like n=1 Tax=Perognathus longimembris pacificus TaxID=214514 RepID=UPI0020188FA6|nr:myristoylated alanine-rich C-kinase substrate-like [Perognathus longimembris pacificus]